ncbi:hypothetical protein N2152v2_007385 [Parachlorella kessleri]
MLTALLSIFTQKNSFQSHGIPTLQSTTTADTSDSSEEEHVAVQLLVAGEQVQLVFACRGKNISQVEEPEADDLRYRVQLQESFSPARPVHLILLPTSKEASSSLTHSVSAWLTDRESEAEQEPTVQY